MRLTFSSNLSDLLDLLQSCLEADAECYLVGGALRDIIMERTVHDLDFAMPEDPVPLARRVAERLNAGFFVLDDERHTARVVYHTSQQDFFPLDFVQFTGADLNEDLSNRDFTINALAVSIRDRSDVIDPLNGWKDIKAKRLCICQPSSLLDDPVRVLRGVRLAMQLGFSYAPELEKLMRQAAPHLSETTCERQRDEFFKILEGPHPAAGIAHLHQFHVFETLITHLSTQAPAHTPPIFERSLKALEYFDLILTSLIQESAADVWQRWWVSWIVSELGDFSDELRVYFSEEITPGRSVRGLALLGALLQGIGKPAAKQVGEGNLLRYDMDNALNADLAGEVAKRFKLSNAECAWVRTMVRCHHRLLPMMESEGPPGRRAIYRFFKDAGRVGAAIAILSLADTAAAYGENLSEEYWVKTMSVAKRMLSAWWRHRKEYISPDPLLNGDDLQRLFALKPGERIGRLLAELKEAQASGEVSNRGDAVRFIEGRLSDA